MSASPFCPHCGALNPSAEATCFACGHLLTSGAPAAVDQSGLQRVLRQRYRLLRQIGAGGFAAVYKAEDTQLGNRLVAVKEMSARGLTPKETQEATEGFHQEALLLARLSHPNLPRIYEQFEEDGRWYLVMDFIEGQTLEGYLEDRGGSLPIKEALQLGVQLTNVLGYLHARQPPIVFRDLKPSNVMLTPDGRVYLIDFGIARLFKPGQAKDTMAFGSPGFAAPEQYGKAQTTPRSDVFSLGALLHHLISGIDPSDTPFRFKPLTMPRPGGLSALIERMVDLDVAKRPATMELIRTDLEHMLNSPAPWRADDGRAPVPNPHTTPALATTSAFPSVAPPPPSWQVQNTGQFTQGAPVLPPPVQQKKKRRWGIWAVVIVVGYLVISGAFHNSLTNYEGSSVDNFSSTDTPVPTGNVVPVHAVAWSPNGAELAFGGADNTVDIIGSGKSAYYTDLEEVNGVAWSPDGQYLAVAGDSNKVVILDSAGNLLSSFTVLSPTINALAWSSHFNALAVAGSDGQVLVAIALTGGTITTYQGNGKAVTTIAWSPDGTYLAFGGADQTVQVWDNAAKSIAYTYQTNGPVTGIAWSSDGQSIASADASGTVAVWDAMTGKSVVVYADSGSPMPTSVAWSSDGTYLAAGDNQNTVRVWQAGDVVPLYTYTEHTGTVHALSWDTGDTTIASASDDGTVRVWDALTGSTQASYQQP